MRCELDLSYREILDTNLQPELRVAYLNSSDGAFETAKNFYEGFPSVINYGATHGTAFPLESREAVAKARREQLNGKLETVSLVTTHDFVMKEWVDSERLHPEMIEAVKAGKFKIFENITFIQLPVNNRAKVFLGEHYVNKKGFAQVFFVEENDMLMKILEEQFGMPCYAVRSANIHGQLEAMDYQDAVTYAREIKAPLIAPLHPNLIFKQYLRARKGSQPMLLIPEKGEELVVKILRLGNTGEATLRRLIAGIFGKKITVEKQEFKPSPEGRKTYNTDRAITDPWLIRNDLLKASGVLY